MSQQVPWWKITVVSSIVLCLALALGASGQGSKSGSTFATVDLQKINAEYKARQLALADFQSLNTKYQAMLQRRDDMWLLTDDEQKQIDAIVDKGAAATDADKAKRAELEKKASTLSDEYKALISKPEKDLTADDRQKIQDKQAIYNKAKTEFASLKDDLSAKLAQSDKENSAKLLDTLRKAVAKVAEQKNVSIVFDSQIALYAGSDLTDPVIAELNKK